MVVGTIVAILLVCLGAVLMNQAIPRQAPPAVPQAAGETGIVRLQELVQAHPAYGDLQKLLQERKELKARLQESTELAAPLAVQPPEVEQKPFDDSVWQKNAQDVIGRRAEIERAQKKAAADYKASTEEDYKARRDAINADPSIELNEIYRRLARTTTGSHVSLYNVENYGSVYETYMSDYMPSEQY